MEANTKTSELKKTEIEDLPGLSMKQIGKLQAQKIFVVRHFFMDGHTMESLDKICGISIAEDVNTAFEEIGLKICLPEK